MSYPSAAVPKLRSRLAVTVLPVRALMIGASRNETWSSPLAVSVLVPTRTHPVAPSISPGEESVHPVKPGPLPQGVPGSTLEASSFAFKFAYVCAVALSSSQSPSAQSWATASAAASAPFCSSRRSTYSLPTSITSAPAPKRTTSIRATQTRTAPSSRRSLLGGFRVRIACSPWPSGSSCRAVRTECRR